MAGEVPEFDVIVIGSGFGGSVTTCRLAEKGYRVCLLERGREYGFNAFPHRIHELKRAFWDPKDGLDGLFEFRSHPDSDVCTLTASGAFFSSDPKPSRVCDPGCHFGVDHRFKDGSHEQPDETLLQ